MTSLNPAEVLQPGEQSLDFPTAMVPSERTTILGRWPLPIALVRSDQFNSAPTQPFIQGVTIIGSITNQPLWVLSGKAALERAFDQSDLMRRSTLRGYGDRKTRAICHCHELCTLAPLGFSHPAAPFFAMTKVPSMKHSVRSSLPRSFTSVTSALRTFSKTPAHTHSWYRRWHVWYGGYRSGRSRHVAPVRRIQRMPFRISRSATLGRPFPSARRGTFGSNGFTISHCSSLRSIGSLPLRVRASVYHF